MIAVHDSVLVPIAQSNLCLEVLESCKNAYVDSTCCLSAIRRHELIDFNAALFVELKSLMSYYVTVKLP